MAPTSAEIETADRLSRRRARMLPALAAIFVIQQAAYFAEPDVATRLVDEVKIGVLMGSIVSAIAGFTLLRLAPRYRPPQIAEIPEGL